MRASPEIQTRLEDKLGNNTLLTLNQRAHTTCRLPAAYGPRPRPWENPSVLAFSPRIVLFILPHVGALFREGHYEK